MVPNSIKERRISVELLPVTDYDKRGSYKTHTKPDNRMGSFGIKIIVLSENS